MYVPGGHDLPRSVPEQLVFLRWLSRGLDPAAWRLPLAPQLAERRIVSVRLALEAMAQHIGIERHEPPEPQRRRVLRSAQKKSLGSRSAMMEAAD